MASARKQRLAGSAVKRAIISWADGFNLALCNALWAGSHTAHLTAPRTEQVGQSDAFRAVPGGSCQTFHSAPQTGPSLSLLGRDGIAGREGLFDGLVDQLLLT